MLVPRTPSFAERTGIRTPEAVTLASFQDWCHQPLGQLSI
jgi:hypothetical protein